MMRMRIFKATVYLLIFSFVSLLFSFYWLNVFIENRYDKQQETKEYSPSFWREVISYYYRNYSKSGLTFPEGYLPSCIIMSNYTLSAINRTKSDQCKKEFAELHCQKIKPAYKGADTLCPRALTNSCPSTRDIRPEMSGQYLGNEKLEYVNKIF